MLELEERSYESQMIITSAEKKRKFCDACTERRATFTPLCFSVDGLVGDEAACFLKHLGRSLSVTWERHYGEVIRWLRARLAFALVQATNVCIRPHAEMSSQQWEYFRSN